MIRLTRPLSTFVIARSKNTFQVHSFKPFGRQQPDRSFGVKHDLNAIREISSVNSPRHPRIFRKFQLEGLTVSFPSICVRKFTAGPFTKLEKKQNHLPAGDQYQFVHVSHDSHFSNEKGKDNSSIKTSWINIFKLSVRSAWKKTTVAFQSTRIFFESHLLIANCLVATTLFSLGDLICQKIEVIDKKEDKNAQIDWNRTKRFAIFALFINGPFYAFWYGKILKAYIASKPSTFYYKAILPTFLDTCIAGPIFLLIFTYLISVMAHDDTSTTMEKLKTDFPFTLVVDLILWPPIQLLNFSFVPASLQGVVVCIADLFWAVFLSWVSNNKSSTEKFISSP